MPPTWIDTRGWTNAWIRMPFVCAFLVFAVCMPGAAHAVTFTGPTNIAVGNAPQSAVTGNFNADADPDLAVVNQGSNNVSVLLGGAGASFSAPVNFVAGTTPLAVVSADFNGDADPELAVVNEASNDVSILTGGTGGTFSAPSNFIVGSTPQSLGVGNFNGDSDLDLAVVNEGSSNVSILLGGAGASFGAPTNFSVGGLPRAVTVSDFNGDSDPDLAVANEATNNVSILVGGSGGTFTGPTNLPVCSAPTWITSGNFNGDSDPDLAVVNELCHNVSVLLGGAGAAFGTATNFAVGNLPDGVTVGEFNGDSDPDLAVANQGSDNVSVLLGGVGGSFAGPTDFASGDGPTSVAVGDFDGDADQDLAVTNELVDNIGILLLDSGPAGYVRPKGASPMRIALVPAFAACSTPNLLHGPPALSGASNDGSCGPPAQTSSFLAIGAPDANGAPANSVGSVRLRVIAGGVGPPEDSDVAIEFSVTDVRCRAGVSTCGAANNQAGSDYTGELTPNAVFRLTDANNVISGGGSDRATVQDQPLAGSALVQVPCAPTASTSIGATCALTTTLDAVTPGIVLDGKRAIWQLGQVEVLDGGSDGEASTSPNSRFLVQGIFVP